LNLDSLIFGAVLHDGVAELELLMTTLLFETKQNRKGRDGRRGGRFHVLFGFIGKMANKY